MAITALVVKCRTGIAIKYLWIIRQEQSKNAFPADEGWLTEAILRKREFEKFQKFGTYRGPWICNNARPQPLSPTHPNPRSNIMDMKLELIAVPVPDVDRAIVYFKDPDGNGWAVQRLPERPSA
jgi:hypothetical protein